MSRKMRRLDYRPSVYLITDVKLSIDLHETETLVSAKFNIVRNRKDLMTEPLVLDGLNLKLVFVRVNGIFLRDNQYQLTEKNLIINNVPAHFILETCVKINPTENKSCEGLYMSDGMFITQCEPHGFQRITYFIDRPDNLSRYKISIIADKRKYPQLLSNGNLLSSDGLANNPDRQIVYWEDPYPKPCYLFALVAGNMRTLLDHYITKSGRKITIGIHTPPQEIGKAQFALDVLKKAMTWDEETFGLEYDLDTFNLVGVSEFNPAAMENKGLNIFQLGSIIASPDTSPDHVYEAIVHIVSHEYFHNYAGNRVTVKDWFQLALKEGLANYKENCFCEEQLGIINTRIENINLLKSEQFKEDAGPNAAPVRPDAVTAIDNFYTSTTYDKGAEILRMLSLLLSKTTFHEGIVHYFKNNDGTAVDIDTFIRSIEAVSEQNLTQFKLWYSQAGTPEVTVTEHYDAVAKTYRLDMKQYCPPRQINPQNCPC